jgi:hypothetical protein
MLNMVLPQTRNCAPPLNLAPVPPFKPHSVIEFSSYCPSNTVYCSPTYSQVPNTNIVTQYPTAPIVPSFTPSDQNASLSFQPSQFVEAKKPLKSLTSFFDGFLETARNAKQIHASTDDPPGNDDY